MIIPIALDLSNHDAFPEHQPDASDFKSLLNCLQSAPCVLLYNGDDLLSSTLLTQQDLIPIKYRDTYRGLLQRLPKQKIATWNGIIDQHLPPFLYEQNHILAVSRATYCVALDNNLDEVSVRVPEAPNAEITMWKSIDTSDTFEATQTLMRLPILIGDLRSVLWTTRFQPVLQQMKWQSISIVDRYLIGDDDKFNYNTLKFLIDKINENCCNSITMNIYIESNTFVFQHRQPGRVVDKMSDLLKHFDNILALSHNITKLNIYAYNNIHIKDPFHDRFMFLCSSEGVLYTYSIGAGFTVFGTDPIKKETTFQMWVDTTHTNSKLYESLQKMHKHHRKQLLYDWKKVKYYLTPE